MVQLAQGHEPGHQDLPNRWRSPLTSLTKCLRKPWRGGNEVYLPRCRGGLARQARTPHPWRAMYAARVLRYRSGRAPTPAHRRRRQGHAGEEGPFIRVICPYQQRSRLGRGALLRPPPLRGLQDHHRSISHTRSTRLSKSCKTPCESLAEIL
jgi:hypothetical protein